MMQEVEHKEIPVPTSDGSVNSDVAKLAKVKDASDSATPSLTTPPLSNVELPADMSQEKPENESFKNSAWGLPGWLKSASSNHFVQKVMEKTQTSVDKMITILDPGMAPYIKGRGGIEVIVGSDKEVKYGAVRDAFQHIFGTASVIGLPAQSNVAAQPVGYSAGLKGAQERIKSLRKNEEIDEKQLCVAIENFVVEQLPDHWFDVACILLDDPENNIKFEVFSLAVPVDADIIADMQKATPTDYDLRWSGLAVTIGETMQKRLPWVTPTDWHKALTGQSRRDILYSASLVLVELYKRRLPERTNEQQL